MISPVEGKQVFRFYGAKGRLAAVGWGALYIFVGVEWLPFETPTNNIRFYLALATGLLFIYFGLKEFYRIFAWRNQRFEIEGDEIRYFENHCDFTLVRQVKSIVSLRYRLFLGNRWEYFVTFPGPCEIRFSRTLERRDEFVQLLETKAGIKFECADRARPSRKLNGRLND